MKKTLAPFILIILVTTFFACQDKIEDTYKVNAPIYLTYNELRTNSLKVAEEQAIIQPGKLYFKDKTIFVNEYQKGIHVIDNTDPSAPKVLKFIEIPGNVDLAIKENILYADSYVDLVALDISDLENIKEVGRVEDVFPYMIPYYEDGYLEEIKPDEGIVIGWEEKDKTVEVEMNNNYYPNYRLYTMDMAFSEGGIRTLSNAPSGGQAMNFGVGGSMARFTLYDKYLYTVDNSNLKLFNVENAAVPTLESTQQLGWNIETLFPYNKKLFIGSMTGMIIYSLEDPSNPVYISQFNHIRSCDPVVVEDDYAYVTLRAGGFCGGSESVLDVIDISNISSPNLVKEYAMQEPYGLGIDNSTLFVCDGSAGLKIYDASDPLRISQNMLAGYPEINAFDVIPLGEVLLMIGSDGLYQYDYSNLKDIKQLSQIPIYSDEF